MRKAMHLCAYWLLLLLCLSSRVSAQDSTSLFTKVISSPDKLFSALDKKTRSAEEKLDKQRDKYLDKLARQESKLKRKLLKKDPQLALSLFSNSDSQYKSAKNGTAFITQYTNVYSGHLDSLSTALRFLQAGSSNGFDVKPEITKALQNYKNLQDKFNQAEQLKRFLNQRQELLKQQLLKFGLVKQYKHFQKQVYYYKAQVQAYKAAFEDPTKWERKLMDLAMELPQFKSFFARNSQLAQLFALPGGEPATVAPLDGLQTRASMQQLLQDRFGSSPEVNQMLQQHTQSAQGQLNALKNKASSYTSGAYGNGNAEQPDFKPNNQKTKSFLKRLEYGTNLQSQRARNYFPVTSDIGLSLGYKLNDKSIIGLGASYKLGWGTGFDHIRITHQGVGLRTFMDWKLKSSFFISGGYELNYRNVINSVEQLKVYSAWQRSGLLGLSKKYQISKKFKGNMQLLWDFLSYQQLPQTQPLLFRIGYSIK